jgi:hypothetical protein
MGRHGVAVADRDDVYYICPVPDGLAVEACDAIIDIDQQLTPISEADDGSE